MVDFFTNLNVLGLNFGQFWVACIFLYFLIGMGRSLIADLYNDVPDEDANYGQEVEYEVTQRRKLRSCQSCGTRLSVSKCSACGYDNPQYEYRKVKRIRYE